MSGIYQYAGGQGKEGGYGARTEMEDDECPETNNLNVINIMRKINF